MRKGKVQVIMKWDMLKELSVFAPVIWMIEILDWFPLSLSLCLYIHTQHTYVHIVNLFVTLTYDEGIQYIVGRELNVSIEDQTMSLIILDEIEIIIGCSTFDFRT